MKLRR